MKIARAFRPDGRAVRTRKIQSDHSEGLHKARSPDICFLYVLLLPKVDPMSLNYVMVGSNDVVRTRPYFDAVLSLIGGTVFADYSPHCFCYEMRGGGRIWVATPHDEKAATPGNGNMVGLLCDSEAEVRAAHATALANGGTNEGDPGPRPQYGPDFYGAYVRDLDGNKMSFVYFGK